jgi:2-C-methyl-D-erythritol 2,4-cyclodiphosphate synthase
MNEMRKNIAETCGVSAETINVKATTTEMMGFTGRGEGIAAYAVTLLQSTSPKS